MVLHRVVGLQGWMAAENEKRETWTIGAKGPDTIGQPV